ncbi:recombinase family protein, partial [Patescibacteria group bacterium]
MVLFVGRQAPTRSASSTRWYNGKCNTIQSEEAIFFGSNSRLGTVWSFPNCVAPRRLFELRRATMNELLVNVRPVYFLYVRKSTDVEDKQVLSIAAQITELKEFAARMGVHIVEVIIEKQTAKKPGRKKFNKMLERIEAGEANGILAWMPDRLSRNSIDSGKIIYILDNHVLIDVNYPHFWFENTPQ